jgi:16S rRNA G966 N2-methylase RsmD
LARRNLHAVAAGLGGSASVTVVTANALSWLRRGRPAGCAAFDLIYADPPYAAGLHTPLAEAVRSGNWLAADGVLLLECARQAIPPCPPGWRLRGDPRCYGQTCLLMLELSPRECCPADTDSRPPQTTPPG